MNKSLLVSLVSLSLLSFGAGARERMVDGIPDEDVVQIVSMVGQPGYSTQAALVKTAGDSELSLVIIESQGVANYMVVDNNKLNSVIENPGTSPVLSVNKSGSLLLTQDNGQFPSRDMWQRTFTVSYRNGNYVLSGFTFAWNDTVAGTIQTCDYNLLTGKGVLNGKKVRVRTQPVKIQNLVDSEKLYSCDGW